MAEGEEVGWIAPWYLCAFTPQICKFGGGNNQSEFSEQVLACASIQLKASVHGQDLCLSTVFPLALRSFNIEVPYKAPRKFSYLVALGAKGKDLSYG